MSSQRKILYLLLKVAGPLVPTVAGPSMLNLECPSFLSVFITDLQYGRKLGNWEPCYMIKEGWAKCLREEKYLTNFVRISPECIDTSLVKSWRSDCQSKSSCSFKVTEGLIQMDPACPGTKEMRTEHICGKNLIVFSDFCWICVWWYFQFSELCTMGFPGQLCFLPGWFSPCQQMGKPEGSRKHDRGRKKVPPLSSFWPLFDCRIELIEALFRALNQEKHDRVNLNSRYLSS